VLSVRPSRYGLLAVLARGEQRIFVHDGVLLFTTEDEAMAEETVHLPLLLHPNPRRILMVGGGLGGGLVQALAHAPARIDYAEMDPEVLSLARVFASDRTRAALDDPRVHALSEDARRVLRAASARYDVILIDLPVAQNALQARLATQACFADARRALAPGGLLALVTPGSDAYLDRAARLRHASVLATLRAVFPSVGAIPGAHSFFWASESEVVARPALLVARMRERGLVLSRIGPTWIADKLLPFHLQDYARSLAGVQGMVNHDFRPVVYLLGLAEELERMSPALAHAALATLRPHAHEALIALGTLVVLAFVLLARRGRARPGLAVWTAGAAALALQMVVLLAYQAILGHLYHALGVMTAAGMIGMALGAWASSRWLRGRKVLAWACLLAAATCALAPPGLSLARVLPSWASMLVALLAFVVGVGTGSVYPAAVQVSAQADAPARLYAWDLVGAAGAAAGTSLLAVPLLGFFPVAWLAAAACAAAGLASLRGD
jgi:spermidine synthase